MITAASLKSVQDRIDGARSRSGRHDDPPIEIIAVTKAFAFEAILGAYQTGLRSIGEVRVQEASAKFRRIPELPGLKRRLIGHLQSNKARNAVDIFDTIDTIDSVKVANKVASIAREQGDVIPVLVQVNTAEDPAKFGFKSQETEEILEIMSMEGLKVEGLMTIGELTKDEPKIRGVFRRLRILRDELNAQVSQEKRMVHLSMGMSADFEIAVEEGATILRLGTILFGPRPT